jgi:hypothetical protein
MRPDLPFDLSKVDHHPVVAGMVDVLCAKTSNSDRKFFTVLAAYFLSKVAANMWATILTKDRGELPVNCYAVTLATSGFGKGYSVKIIEEELLKGFFDRFREQTYPGLVRASLWAIANKRLARSQNPGQNPQEMFEKVEKDFHSLGAYVSTYSEGTPEGSRQLRTKILMGGCGALSLQIDEIGSNLLKNTDLLTLYLELFDTGRVKDKVTKSTAENKRIEPIDGSTPTNALLFGTDTKLFDAGPVEKEFLSFLSTGYARRCLFGAGIPAGETEVTAEELYAQLTQAENSHMVQRLATLFAELADPGRFGWQVQMGDNEAIELLRYKLACEKASKRLPEHEETRIAELRHRYSKALKLIGALAFTDGVADVEMIHVHQAIKIVEESGEAFNRMLTRKKPYQKLAEFLAAVGSEQTHSDLDAALPFYPEAANKRKDMLLDAISWGYRNHIVIRQTYGEGGVPFLSAKALEKTDLSRVTFAYSGHFAYEFKAERQPFDQLHRVIRAAQEDGSPIHWVTHHFEDGHRKTENAIPGFDLVVLDVDGEFPLSAAQDLFAEWTHLIHTTKSHGVNGEDRYRIILPTNYRLEMTADEYREFMDNVHGWLAWKLKDESSNKIAQKWTSCPQGGHVYNWGELFDVTRFIPRTSRNEALKAQVKELKDCDALERWFAPRMGPEGSGRNNEMIKFALALVDGGLPLVEVEARVRAFDRKLQHPLGETELRDSILKTVAARCQARGTP